MSRLLPLFGFLVLVGLFGFGIWWNTQHDQHEIVSPLIDKPAPAFALPVLDDAGRTVSKAPELVQAIQEWLAQPGPALLNVKVAPQQLVMPPTVELEAAAGMGIYTARAVLHGRGGDVWEMIKENFV